METVLAARYVTEALLPEVADALYAVCLKFGCDLRWTRESNGKPGTLEEFYAEPIISGYSAPFGVRTDVSTTVRYAESRWERLKGETEFRRGKREGYVQFQASMNARMGIPKGLDLFDTTDGRKRFLCWANQYVLGDGSVCFRLDTNAGFLWIRGADQNGMSTRMLHQGLSDDVDAPESRGPAVVELMEYDFYRNVGEKPFYEQIPWEGMTSTGRGKRPWRIAKSSLSLHCALRLDVVGRFNDRLKGRPRQVVQWPYQTAWEHRTAGDKNLLIPLDYI